MKIAKFFGMLLAFLMIAPVVLADGMIIDPDWEYHPEERQAAYINYEDGLQKMILAIDVPDKDIAGSFWLFPVPASPNEVVIDVVDSVPNFYGYNVVDRAEWSADEIIRDVQATQVYPIFFNPHRVYMMSSVSDVSTGSVKAMAESFEGVEVHEHIEKEGLVTELVTARSGEALYNYIKQRRNLETVQTIPVLNEYIGDDYTFVISWISEGNTYRGSNNEYNEDEIYRYNGYTNRHVGVQVMFPTEKLFFPLLPTSVYDSETIPATIYVMDFVTPEIYDSIKSFTTIDYYIEDYASMPYSLDTFSNEQQISNLEYTRININAPSKYYLEDLWMNFEVPPTVSYANILVNHSKLVWFSLVGIISVVTSTILGIILFRKKDPLQFVALGLANYFSIIGLIVATFFMKTKNVDPKVKQELKKYGATMIISDKRKIWFILGFTVIFMVLTIFARWLIKLPLF